MLGRYRSYSGQRGKEHNLVRNFVETNTIGSLRNTRCTPRQRKWHKNTRSDFESISHCRGVRVFLKLPTYNPATSVCFHIAVSCDGFRKFCRLKFINATRCHLRTVTVYNWKNKEYSLLVTSSKHLLNKTPLLFYKVINDLFHVMIII